MASLGLKFALALCISMIVGSSAEQNNGCEKVRDIIEGGLKVSQNELVSEVFAKYFDGLLEKTFDDNQLYQAYMYGIFNTMTTAGPSLTGFINAMKLNVKASTGQDVDVPKYMKMTHLVLPACEEFNRLIEKAREVPLEHPEECLPATRAGYLGHICMFANGHVATMATPTK